MHAEFEINNTPTQKKSSEKHHNLDISPPVSAHDASNALASHRQAPPLSSKGQIMMQFYDTSVNSRPPSSLAHEQPIQRKANNTGLPGNLKTGIERLSGYSMDDVKVHYNSSKPAQLQAHAFAQGTNIHLAPGQEKHLPHEAWHIVQQKQGRVKPTIQLKGKVNVNDDIDLEREADEMGKRALLADYSAKDSQLSSRNIEQETIIQRRLNNGQLNVVGENHDESDARRDVEKQHCEEAFGSYWKEAEFPIRVMGGKSTYGDHPYLVLRNYLELWIQGGTHGVLDNPNIATTQRILMVGQIYTRIYSALDPDVQRLIIQSIQLPLFNEFDTGAMVNRDRDIRNIETQWNLLVRSLSAIANASNRLRVPGAQHTWNLNPRRERAIRGAWAIVVRSRRNLRGLVSNTFAAGRILRSDHMHEVAEAYAHRNGIWKVGNDHIQDIQNRHRGQRSYNLVTKDDYDRELLWYQYPWTAPIREFWGYMSGRGI